jgi:hypothetical protein
LLQKYQAWNQGAGKGLIATFHAVSVASTSGGLKVLTVTLKKAKPTVARAARSLVPACADPAGYWSVLLMHMNAAVASTGSKSNARAAMKDVPTIECKLAAELPAEASESTRTTGRRACVPRGSCAANGPSGELIWPNRAFDVS